MARRKKKNISAKNVAILLGIAVVVIAFAGFNGGSNSLTGSATGTTNVTIQSLLSITMVNDLVEFGVKNISDTDNTTDNSPLPFLIENDGSVDADVNVSATALWSSVGLDTVNYQFKCGVNQSACAGSSATTYTNMSATTKLVVDNLTFVDSADAAEVDIAIVVPAGESAGVKTSTVTFTASIN